MVAHLHLDSWRRSFSTRLSTSCGQFKFAEERHASRRGTRPRKEVTTGQKRPRRVLRRPFDGADLGLGCYGTARRPSLVAWPGLAEKLRRAFPDSHLPSKRCPPLVRSRGGLREAHLPTEQSSPRQEARLPPPDEHPRRASRAESTSRQGPAQPVGLIWRIRERSAFTRLACEGRRTRAGVLWCTYIPDPSASPPRVAYALGRAIGPAVVRNQLRRRLRALLDDVSLPPGLYLIGAQPDAAQRSGSELAFDLNRLVGSMRA